MRPIATPSRGCRFVLFVTFDLQMQIWFPNSSKNIVWIELFCMSSHWRTSSDPPSEEMIRYDITMVTWELQTKLLHYFFTSKNKSNLHFKHLNMCTYIMKYMDFWPPAQSASWHSNSSKQKISRHCPHRHQLWWYSGPSSHGTMDLWNIPNSKVHTSRNLPTMKKNKIRSEKLAICPKKINWQIKFNWRIWSTFDIYMNICIYIHNYIRIHIYTCVYIHTYI